MDNIYLNKQLDVFIVADDHIIGYLPNNDLIILVQELGLTIEEFAGINSFNQFTFIQDHINSLLEENESFRPIYKQTLVNIKTKDLIPFNVDMILKHQEKRKAWNYALGMIKIDGLEPSEDFLELVEKEIKGEITDKDIKDFLDHKYKMIAENGKNKKKTT